MSKPDLVVLAQEERTDLLALLEELSAEQWNAPSLCTEWRVRDVATHIVSYDELSVPRLGGHDEGCHRHLDGGPRPGGDETRAMFGKLSKHSAFGMTSALDAGGWRSRVPPWPRAPKADSSQGCPCAERLGLTKVSRPRLLSPQPCHPPGTMRQVPRLVPPSQNASLDVRLCR